MMTIDWTNDEELHFLKDITGVCPLLIWINRQNSEGRKVEPPCIGGAL